MPRDDSSAQRAARLRLGRLPGYVRQPDPARRGGEDGRTYKKGWEVRFTARSEEEITEIRELVTAAGFAPARPFFKGHQLIQPVYGIAAVQAYLAARESVEAAETTVRTDRRTAGIPEQIRRDPDSVAAAVRAAESAAAEAAAGAAARAGGSAGGAGAGALDGGAVGGAADGSAAGAGGDAVRTGEAAGRTGSEAAARTAGSAGATVRFGGASATRSAHES
ncbi:hypothetical protein K353_02153 [Kitasatospora sp. SolWspMP-SS2h]|uniref:hypothetical protein n=1 Tax=Kitasatospora sp. SolWspMP-SS2h TaxID=1305729 RepID=UPI000DC02BDD|nr:hypothetical protein [Kitasatospora sp. SolWspMP-SS2h]RAJ43135.1 hypothetical protein K353_02153 [Kitasatospora sp. SolWspMP-SS2h]